MILNFRNSQAQCWRLIAHTVGCWNIISTIFITCFNKDVQFQTACLTTLLISSSTVIWFDIQMDSDFVCMWHRVNNFYFTWHIPFAGFRIDGFLRKIEIRKENTCFGTCYQFSFHNWNTSSNNYSIIDKKKIKTRIEEMDKTFILHSLHTAYGYHSQAAENKKRTNISNKRCNTNVCFTWFLTQCLCIWMLWGKNIIFKWNLKNINKRTKNKLINSVKSYGSRIRIGFQLLIISNTKRNWFLSSLHNLHSEHIVSFLPFFVIPQNVNFPLRNNFPFDAFNKIDFLYVLKPDTLLHKT